jgi:S1-C subfamily serine protease
MPIGIFLIALCFFIVSGVCAEMPSTQLIETQVLRVFAVKRAAYYHKPWKTPDFSNVRGTGFFFTHKEAFPGKRALILTNAHTVSQAQSIKISNGREKHRYDVRLLGICDTADFAVLEMEPSEIQLYERRNGPIVPLELGNSDLLRVGDKVFGWGYPLGGEGISKSEQGEISRIEVNRYAHSEDQWLMVQASLQQNRGNSGGPVFHGGQVIGMAFQGMKETDRINYFIPINVIKNLFPVINDPEKIPRWRFVMQSMFPRLKEYYGLTQDQGGILLAYIIPGGGPYEFGLRENDIIVSVDNLEVDNFGELFFKPLDQRVYWLEVLNRKKLGDPLRITVLRNGKKVDIDGQVTKGLPKFVSKIFQNANYFVMSGIGFVELTMNCLDNLGKSGDTFRAKYADEYPLKPFQKVVLISEIFPEYGLVDPASYLDRVVKVDGDDVLNIEHLYHKLKEMKEQGKKRALLEIKHDLRIPLDLENSDKIDQEIRDRYGILYMKTPGGFTY